MSAKALAKTWTDKPGIKGFLETNDHKRTGKRFIVTAFLFFSAAGILAALMRLQLAFPDSRIVGPDLYNQLFTMHGTTMMFIFAVPVMQGMGIYLVPLMIGTRNTAFPRMTACAYWLYLFGALTLWIGFATNTGADAGWFSYVPLAGPEFGTGKRVDVWNNLVNLTEAMGLMVAVDLATTILKMRAPGMSLRRMPIFVWATLVASIMIIFAMPSVMLAANLVQFDRTFATHFFNPAEGGDVLIWQHLFWFFGHPEVYFIFIPALGFVSTIIPTFARRPLFGHTAVVLSLIGTGFLAFGLWVHHMFATNLPELGKGFFTAMSMMIAIPTAVQIFCWIATLWTGRIHLRVPLLYVLAFFVILVLGGMTGVMVGAVPFDLQVHDTYFVVAHLHYVLLGGAVFPLFGAFFYWFPKFTGRMLDESLGRWQFWLFFVGFNVAFFPMHILGL
ncbi:MAG TPA: cbb3-type cytochrome c oxidase subunit I, partial [Casimicrobiaceae bacterium]